MRGLTALILALIGAYISGTGGALIGGSIGLFLMMRFGFP